MAYKRSGRLTLKRHGDETSHLRGGGEHLDRLILGHAQPHESHQFARALSHFPVLALGLGVGEEAGAGEERAVGVDAGVG